MAQIESIDWGAKRFYLHADTVLNGFDAWIAYAEVRALVQINANNEQNYSLFIHRVGKVKKNLAGTKFTPKYVEFNSGWRGVPYGGSDHELLLYTEMLNPEDGVADRTMFDRSGLANQVDIDPVYEQVEIQVFNTGSGLDASQDSKLTEVHQAHFNKRTWDKQANTVTLYDADGVTPLHVFDTNSDLSEISPQ